MRKSAIVIGGGVAGLACGAYLRMNGYDAAVFEMSGSAGGVSVSWKRKGYVFDGATNWLPGSSSSINFHRIWKEIIDFSEMPCIDFEEFLRVESSNGKTLHVYTDALKLREEMLRLSPEDAPLIRDFTGAIMQASRFKIPIEKPPEMFGLGDMLRLAFTSLPLLAFFLKWRPLTIDAFTRKFKNSDLAGLVRSIFLRHQFFSVVGLILSLSWMHARSAGYPLGGSARLIELVEKRFRSLGGLIRYKAKVTRIIEKNNTACGIQLENGEEHRADIIVSACDASFTLNTLLQNSYQSPKLAGALNGAAVFPSLIQVSLGIRRTFEEVAHKMIIPLEKPISAGSDTGMDHLMVRFCDFDPSFSQEGTTAVVVHLRTTDWKYWYDLRNNDKTQYDKEKARVAKSVIDTLEKRFGPLKDAIEVTDVATPATYIRYTGIFKASYQGWAPTPGVVGKSFPKTLAGLGHFYMAGQWVEPPGGLPRVIISARNAVQLICREDGRRFITLDAPRLT